MASRVRVESAAAQRPDERCIRETSAAPGVRRYRLVARQIRDTIERERIAPGTRLLSERKLAAQLQVSRSTLREGLIVLEIEGVVRIGGGSGVYVCPAPLVRVGADKLAAQDLLTARHMVAAQVATVAARHASDPAIERIRECLLAIDGQPARADAERDFMLALGAAAGNTALLGVIDYLWSEPMDELRWEQRCRAALDIIVTGATARRQVAPVNPG